jgi:hypothetical protein
MMETNWSLPDVLIVDSKNDLNVYLTATEAKPSCCGSDAVKEEKEVSSCCNAEAKESCCKPEEKQTCCRTNSSACTCQNQTSSMASEAKTLVTQLGITDLNEWAGKDNGRLASQISPTNSSQVPSRCMLSSPRRLRAPLRPVDAADWRFKFSPNTERTIEIRCHGSMTIMFH